MIISVLLLLGKKCSKGSKIVNLLLINDYIGKFLIIKFLVYNCSLFSFLILNSYDKFDCSKLCSQNITGSRRLCVDDIFSAL